MLRSLVCCLSIAGIVMLSYGCASVERGAPVSKPTINVNLEKGDYTVLGTAKGSSTVKSYVCGLFKIIDDNKVSFLFIKLFEDQYCFQEPSLFGTVLGFVSVEDRAYYKAIAAVPDADAVLQRSFTKQVSSFPLLYSDEEVTFTGKAIKLKSE